MQDEQRRQDQERAEHVRILERAASPIIERQQVVPARNEIEIAGDRGERCDHGADRETAAQHVEPGGSVLGDDHGEEDHGRRHIPGCRDPACNVGLVQQGNGANGVADIDQDQQQQQRHENQPQPQAGRKEQDGGNERHQLIGAWFDEDDRSRCAGQPYQRALQGEDAGRRYGGRVAAGCCRIRHHALTDPRNAIRTHVFVLDRNDT